MHSYFYKCENSIPDVVVVSLMTASTGGMAGSSRLYALSMNWVSWPVRPSGSFHSALMT